MNWKKQLNEEFPVRDSRTEEFISTEIVEKLIEEATEVAKLIYWEGDTPEHDFQQQLRQRWL